MFVKAKFITSIWSSIKMALIGLQRIYGFCQDQPPTFDDRARSLYIATTGVSRRQMFDEIGMKITAQPSRGRRCRYRSRCCSPDSLAGGWRYSPERRVGLQ